MLIISYNPYSEEAWGSGQWTFGLKPVEVTNIRSAKNTDQWHIIRFDYTHAPEPAPPGEGTCLRRKFSDPDVQEIPEIPQAADWWPAATMKLNLINNEWPLYQCSANTGRTYSMTITPGQRVFMWRTTGETK